MSRRTLTAAAAVLLFAVQLVAVAAPVSAQPIDPDAIDPDALEAKQPDPASVENQSAELTGPTNASVGEIIDLTISSPENAAAFEAALDYDKAALDFGGIYTETAGTRLLSVTNQPSQVAIAGYHCPSESCDGSLTAGVGPITVRFAVVEAGSHQVRISRALAVSAAGDVSALETEAMTIAVSSDDGDAGLRETSGTVGPDIAGDRSPVVRLDADLTSDREVGQADVTEAGLAWGEVRRRGAPCTLDSDRLIAADVDGSGCLDVADLAAVASHSEPLALAQRAAAPGALAELPPGVENATPMVVNTSSDEWDANLNNGVCNTPSGGCSLRAAILQANANAGPDRIHFNIPGAGPHRISLGDQLPTISDMSGALLIDGYTQPGAQPNTSSQLSNASIRIEIRGGGYNGRSSLVITSPNNVIRGLAVYNTFSNIRITGTAATGNQIVGNFIGTNASATYEIPGARNEYIDQAGIEIGDGASDNHIGTPDLADRNVISGNPYSGVRINHASTRGNVVKNNLVGLTPNGNDSLYTYVAGIDVQWGANETIVGGYEDHAGNVVTGNTNYGIDLSHSSKNNRIVGNYLGTDATGTRVRSYTGNLIGLAIKDNTVGNLIEHNVIGGNTRDGIWHRHNFTGGNTFRYNRVGVGVDGSDIGNSRYGMFLSGHDDTYEQNIFANNGSYGVYVSNYNGGNGFSPPQYTERNRLTANSFYSNGTRAIEVTGAHNNISSPRFTSLSTGSAGGTVCDGCRVELYVADNTGGRQFIAGTTASGGGSWSISNGNIRNNRVTALAISSGGDTSEFSSRYNVGSRPSNSGPSIGGLSDRSGVRYGYVEFNVNASDPNGNYLTYSALGLPAGVSIDQRSGQISGRPGSLGTHTVYVRVDDGESVAQRSFNWSVGTPNSAPTINSISNQRGQVGQAVTLDATASDPNGDPLTFSATGLPGGLSIASGGRISGTLSQSGSFNVTVIVTDPTGARSTTSFTWTVSPAPQAFECSVSGSTLSWSDQGASRYYVRQIVNGVDSYVGSTAGTSYQLGNPTGTYKVRYWVGGVAADASCDAPAGGGFSCSVSGSTLSWSDQGASRYYVRQIVNGVDSYVGSTAGTSYQLGNPTGTYKVRFWAGPVAVDATCDA